MELSDIQTAIASLKAAAEISKSILKLKSNAEIREKVLELQAALLEAQNSALSATTSQFELQERVRGLEDELRSINRWNEEEKRYKLVCPWGGVAQVYALRRSEADGNQAHFLCSNCFHERKRVILLPTRRGSWIVMSCPSCKASLETGYRGLGPPQYAEDYDEG